jgi:glycosyltransferase involved in cell wall biosynthesis
MLTKGPKISVIIPTYNRAAYLYESIDSVLCQTYEDLELIVVDDGSSDNTREVVQEYNDLRIKYIYKKNGGAASALNLGIKESKGNYIARLDSDDMFLPEKLEMQIKFIDFNPDIGLVYTQAYNTDEKGNVLELYLKDHTYPNNSLKVLRYFLFPPSQSIMFRKSCIDRVGYFDEDMPITEDWDFCIRMAQYYKFAYIDKPLVKIRKHTKMITSDKIKSAQAILRVMEKHSETLSLGEGKEWLAPHYYNLGRLYLYKRDYKRARGKFFSALRYDPSLLRNFFFFGLTSLPSFMIEGIRDLKGYFKQEIG